MQTRITIFFTPPTRTSLFYAVRYKAGGGSCCRHEKFRIWSECDRIKCLFSHSS